MLELGDGEALDGADLGGRLAVGQRSVALDDANEAVVGSLTTLAGGVFRAANGLLLPEGHNIRGEGLMMAHLRRHGHVHADERGLELSTHVSGAGGFGAEAIFSGEYEPGSRTAMVSMGSVMFTGSATLGIELDDESHDGLEIGGELTAVGRLAIALLNGFKPGEGEAFDIVAHGTASRTGIFSTATGWDVLADLAGAPFYQEQGIRLVVELFGDANEDDVVDLGDIVAMIGKWQATPPVGGGGTVQEPPTPALPAPGGLVAARQGTRRS